MAFTKCEESKRACYKILSELPQGDTKALMARIQAIEAFPDNKSNSVKPIILRDEDRVRKSCIWSPNVGGSVNFAASTGTNPISADTNLLRKIQNLLKKHQMVVKLN